MIQKRKHLFLLFFLLGLLVYQFGGQVLVSATNTFDQIRRFIMAYNAIREFYVDNVSPQRLVNGGIRGMLEELDPHSVFVPPDQVKELSEEYEGKYDGVGIEYVIEEKQPVVVSPIPGSPAERAGLRPGDTILKINGESTYGMSDAAFRSELRGRIGTTVLLRVKRENLSDPLVFQLVREEIPIVSVQAHFMLDATTGYIYLSRFSKTTSDEMEEALHDLELSGMKRLVLDLRFNPGGYLDQAVKVADKFLQGGRRIVYTRGRIQSANEDYYSTDAATHPNFPIVVLINHGTASAAEIVAGALQDWDRAVITGETSFGKGLVQNQIPLKDGSAIRITIARYYTPSGRLIQRPYSKNLVDYYTGSGTTGKNPYARQKVFTTFSGRKVFGGGGIHPDLVSKTPPITSTTSTLLAKRTFFEFATHEAANMKERYISFETFDALFDVDAYELQKFLTFVEDKHIGVNKREFLRDRKFIQQRIKAEIARNLWGTEAYYRIIVGGDPQVHEAMTAFPLAERLAALETGLKR